MKKLGAFVAVFLGLLSAQIAAPAAPIDGVAIKVNGRIVTLFEIDEAMKERKLTRLEAIDFLVQDRLREAEIKRLKIDINDKRLDEEIERIAEANKLTKDELLATLRSQNIEPEAYRRELKNYLTNAELIQKILQSNANVADESDVRGFYEANKMDFMFPSRISATSYAAESEEALQKFLANPLVRSPNIDAKDEEIELNNLPPQIAAVFLETPEKRFTPILNAGNALVVFFIKEKLDVALKPFDEVKNIALQKYAKAREGEILNEYFAKLRASAKVEVLRE